MDIQKILAAVDHTLLRPEATWEEIRQICEDGAAFGCASVCIPPSFVKRAADCLGDKLPVCTVIGFPNGYSTTAVKALEAADAVANGAQEIDMVINIGWVKDHLWNDILREIQAVKEACSGRVLKVIVETCLLTREEKVKLCQIVSDSGADFIKTSTGFSTGGATFDDVRLFAEHVGEGVKIKAAGGIRSREDMEEFLRLGASRLGTSSAVKILCGKS